MIGAIIVLGLVASGTEPTPAAVGEELRLTVDACVDVDEATVRQVMDLELRDARARGAKLPTSVNVRCVDDAQEIRVEPWDSLEQNGARSLRLPPVTDAAPAAREARSRELALAIAELVRRRETEPPPPPEPQPPPPPPVAAPEVKVVAPPSVVLPGPWRLGIVSTYDYFSGGQRLVGGDLIVGVRLGRWIVLQGNSGGRLGADQALPAGHLTVRAVTVGAAAGLLYWPDRRAVGLALMLRAQEYLMRFRLEASGQGTEPTVWLGAFVVAAEPRLFVGLGRHFALEASAAVGFPPRGIVVRTQGIRTRSVSGALVSASLAGVLRF